MIYYNGKTGEYKGDIQPKNFVYTTRSKTNYYVYCLSLVFAPRLFLDFDADACLVIRKPSDFQEMILTTFENKMQGWTGSSEVENLAKDLQNEFPGIRGFSAANLWRIRNFFQQYAENKKLAPLVREITCKYKKISTITKRNSRQIVRIWNFK